jgi:hypothetical protein
LVSFRKFLIGLFGKEIAVLILFFLLIYRQLYHMILIIYTHIIPFFHHILFRVRIFSAKKILRSRLSQPQKPLKRKMVRRGLILTTFLIIT